jgi:hypothetical protein
MRLPTDHLRRLLLGLAPLALVACGPPSPSAIFVNTVDNGVTTASAPSPTMQEGDLVVVDALPHDGDDEMDLCIDASTSGDASAVRVARVRGSCRRFVVVATGSGAARVTFSARGTVTELALNVTPAR